MSLKQVEKFINQIPWLPEDVRVVLTKHGVQFKPKGDTAKYDEELYEKLTSVIYGARYYDSYLKNKEKK